MAKTTQIPLSPENKPHRGKRLTQERIQLIVANYIANGCTDKAQALIAAGYTIKTAKYGNTQIFNNPRVQEEIKKQIQPIVANNQITVISEQNKLLDIADAAYKDKRYAAAVSAHCAIIKTIGGFQADKLPEENLAGKMLDAKRSEDMRKIADLYYANKYLAEQAVKQVESSMIEDVNSGQSEPLQDVSDNLTGGIPSEFQIQDDYSQSDTHSPPEGGA